METIGLKGEELGLKQAVLGKIYYAHSVNGRIESEWQPLKDHLTNVGNLAYEKASHFSAGDIAEIAGLLHDLGKYCEEFQSRLRGSPQRVDHATWGAKVAIERYPQFGILLAYAIAGHHAGLADGRESDKTQKISALSNRLNRELDTKLDAIWEEQIDLKEKPTQPQMNPMRGLNIFQFSLLGRMLYSCLVDADFLDTEAFYHRIENSPQRDEAYPTLLELRGTLDRYLRQTRFQSKEGINAVRARILKYVRTQADQVPGLFSLNVPTGGGKTLTSLAFALDHAIKHGQRRVILVIPFTSIVEQNAAVFREALGDLGEQAVLEHHSAFMDEKVDYSNPDSRDKLRQAAENWEAPIVVTTAVQFFESLFANRSSQCRKLHNIANSVVILDEAQTIPTKLLRPCVATIAELALNYRTSLVLCTATQPALLAEDGFDGGLEHVRELAPNPFQLHQDLARVCVKHIGPLYDDDLTEQLIHQHQVLCIVNNRRHARSLFEQIRHITGSYHLTTLMCAQHRSHKLKEIREKLDVGEPCRVIATSLIEAGVDVDFPMVYRAEAGLDSIAQAAGRCNREGRQSKETSLVKVFTVASDWRMPPELEQYAQACRTVFRKSSDNPLSLDAIRDYFQEVYWTKGKHLDAYSLLKQTQDGGIDGIPYEQMARQFRMIESNMKPVIVPYASLTEEADRRELKILIQQLAHAEYVGLAGRNIQRYLVQVPEYGLNALRAAGAVQPVQPERFGEQFLELVSTNLYDPECGLTWEDPDFISADKSVIS